MAESVRLDSSDVQRQKGGLILMPQSASYPAVDIPQLEQLETPDDIAMEMWDNEAFHFDDSQSDISAALLSASGKACSEAKSGEFTTIIASRIAHLNGLRALALLGVVLFHFKHGCPGGFLGVDVFFVLSGYLMTRSIRSQIERGSFRYRSFIVRRFWRLYPALLCTILGTLLLTYLFFSDELVAQVAKSSEATIFALSNVLFTSEEGYFGTSSSLKPLLHTWSLSVEWQFYIFWPFLMLGLHFWDISSVWPYVILSAFSFGYGCFTATFDEQGAFFLLPGRVFEFGMGAITLLQAPTVASEIYGSAMSASGLTLIVTSFLFLESSIAAPALVALPALFGALLIIASPSDAKANYVFKFAPVEYLGKISYSAYLVHWPVYVFFNNIYEHSSPSWMVEAVVIIIMTAISAALYHQIEDSMRNGKDQRHKIIGFGMIAVCLLASHHAIKTAGWKGRYTTPRAGLAETFPSTFYAQELKNIYKPTLRKIPGTSAKLTYGIVSKNANLSVVGGDRFDGILVGDSFAAPFAGALDSIAKEESQSFVVSSQFSCSPFFDKDSMDPAIKDYPKNSKRGQECKDNIRKRNLDLIRATKTDTVFLAGNWLATSQMWKVVHSKEKKKDTKKYPSQIEKTVRLLHSMGKKVVVIGMVPGSHYNPRACLSSSGLLAFLKECPPITRYVEPVSGPKDMQVKIRNRNTIRQAFNDLLAESPIFKRGIADHWLSFVDPFNSLCDSETGECSTIHNGNLVYYDDHHLSANGTRIMKDDLRFAWKAVNLEQNLQRNAETVAANKTRVKNLVKSVLKDISALGIDYEQAAM